MNVQVTDRVDLDQVAAFMRLPDIYWPMVDALSPAPEQLDLGGFLTHHDTLSYGVMVDKNLVGLVQFIRRTSIGCEMQASFQPFFRGVRAKLAAQYAIALTFRDKGIQKVWCNIPEDNKPAQRMVSAMGFVREGRLTKAIVRNESQWMKAGMHDIIIYGLCANTYKGN